MNKMPPFHLPTWIFFMLIIGPGFINGCVLTTAEPLLNDTPASHAAVYVPRSPRPLPLPARDEPGPTLAGRDLGLAQCIKIALERNPETRKSWQASRSAAAGVGQARAPYLPAADFTAEASRNDSVILDSQQETGAANTFTAGFGVRYLLFDGGARSAGLKGAEAELLFANFQHNTTLQSVALQVEEAYYRLLAAKALKQVASQAVRQTQYHLDVARARQTNGIVARSDVLKAETEKADADLQLVRARSEAQIARGQLANAMGLKPTISFKVAALPPHPHQQELADIKKIMAEAAVRRPELRAALANIEANRARVKATQAAYWPQITVNSDYGWRDRTFLPDRDEWSLGVGVTLPLFEGLNRKYSMQRAKSELLRTKAEYERLARAVELDVWTAYSRLTEAKQAIGAAQTLVASAEESARLTEGEYKNGAASIIEVIDAQTARTTAKISLVQANLDWYTAMARLERAIGQTLARQKNKTVHQGLRFLANHGL